MDKQDGTRPSKFSQKEAGEIKSNILIFAFFLLISFIFWYLSSLGKDTETDIKYPVRYSNVAGNRQLTAGLPSRLNLVLKGSGYSILRLKIFRKRTPVVVDFSKVKYKHISGSKSNDYYIVTTDLIAGFNSQLKSVCKISSIKPDTLYFSFRQVQK